MMASSTKLKEKQKTNGTEKKERKNPKKKRERKEMNKTVIFYGDKVGLGKLLLRIKKHLT
jgi:hypothetical protein